MRFVPMILVLAAALQACGVKGPLYLPPPAATSPQAPAADKDRERP
ncbi:LPS translocon maturation chaperone LptM [Thiobacter aerophilum]